MLTTFITSNLKNRMWPATALLAICLMLAQGCGGGGSGSGSGTTLLKGDPAFRAVAVGGYKALGAGAAYPFDALMIASPTGSAMHTKAAALLVSMLKHTSTVKRGASRSGGALTYVPSLNLYSSGVNFTKNVASVSFFSDSAGTQPAGALTLTFPVSVSDLPDPNSFPSYPAVVTVAVNITAGNLPCNGNVVITFSDQAAANTMTGTMTLTKDNVVIDVNLTLDDQFNVAGTITVHENGATIQMTGVTGNALSPLSSNITVSPYGWTGTATINLTTGAITVQLNTGTGTSSAASDTSGNITVTYADGTTETVNNAYLTSLVSSGSGGGTTATYNAPFVFTTAQRTITMINGTGQSIGFTTQGTPLFWSSPNAQPQALALPAGVTYAGVTGINDAGQIVGWTNGTGSTSQSAAIYWSSATAQPVTLAAPSGVTSISANYINNNGQIVGLSGTVTSTSDTTAGVYWSSPTAQPAVLQTAPTFISPGGQMVDSNNNLYYATPTSSPVTLPALSGDGQGTSPKGVNASGLIVGASFPGGGIAHAVTWASGTAPVQALAMQFPQINSQSSSANSINSSGVIAGSFVGYTDAGDNPYFVAVIWKNGQITDLNTLIPSGNAATLTSAVQITDSGWILGNATTNKNLVLTGQYILQPK